ncbi:MAG: HD family hydrolase [Candidatus Poribacteria bacterium]
MPVSASSVIDLLDALETQKNLPRTGWRLRGIRDGESIADHCHRTTTTAMLLADVLVERGVTLDVERVLRIAILHEIAECRVGDIPYPAQKYLPDGAKEEAEAAAARDLLNPLGELGERYYDLWDEFEQRETTESRVVRVADKLEMMVQAWEYERAGATDLDNFWQNAWNVRDFDAFPLAGELMDELRRRLVATREAKRHHAVDLAAEPAPGGRD